eukprot:Partr_v1_DN24431_c0_g1_i1_m66268
MPTQVNCPSITVKSLSASDKSEFIWAKLVANPKSAEWFSTLQVLGLFVESMAPTFSTSNDWFPAGRKKLVHTQGLVAKIRFVKSQAATPFTGVFASGADFGIARVSSAARPSPGENFLTPSIALKFLRDGVASANTFAMYTLEEQSGGNFFQHNLSNHVPRPTTGALKAVHTKFRQASNFPGQVGLSDIARFDQNGKESALPLFPFKLILVPNKELQASTANYTATTWKNQFPLIAKGTILYRVHGWASPQDTGLGVEIGHIEIVEPFTESLAGDTELFFQHVRIEDDQKLRPEWSYTIAK